MTSIPVCLLSLFLARTVGHALVVAGAVAVASAAAAADAVAVALIESVSGNPSGVEFNGLARPAIAAADWPVSVQFSLSSPGGNAPVSAHNG